MTSEGHKLNQCEYFQTPAYWVWLNSSVHQAFCPCLGQGGGNSHAHVERRMESTCEFLTERGFYIQLQSTFYQVCAFVIVSVVIQFRGYERAGGQWITDSAIITYMKKCPLAYFTTCFHNMDCSNSIAILQNCCCLKKTKWHKRYICECESGLSTFLLVRPLV